MKTTVELPDEIYRQAKAQAALRGQKLKDLIEQGLRLVLETAAPASRRPTLSDLMQHGRGVVESGIPDLASDPAHLHRFGRDESDH